MKIWKVLCSLVLVVGYFPVVLAAASPEGVWTSLDDTTGAKRAEIRLTVSGNTLNGSVVKVYPQPGDRGICVNCPGAFKDKKVLGLGIVWGLKDEGNGVWSGGYILDPKIGKVYRVKMTVDGDKLHVRGYIGVSLIGRTQTWVR